MELLRRPPPEIYSQWYECLLCQHCFVGSEAESERDQHMNKEHYFKPAPDPREALIHAALLWWEAHRPHEWSTDDHLAIPKHCTVGCIDEQLALAAADYVRATKVPK